MGGRRPARTDSRPPEPAADRPAGSLWIATGGSARTRSGLRYRQGHDPTSIQPLTMVTRGCERLRDFVRQQGQAVLKPLVGYGGRGVSLVGAGKLKNLTGIIQSIARDGYVIAQEYLPVAAEGDTRLFLIGLDIIGERDWSRRASSHPAVWATPDVSRRSISSGP